MHGRVLSLQCTHVMLIKINENLQMKHITRWAECFADRYHGELFPIILFWICTCSTVTVYLKGQYSKKCFFWLIQTPSKTEIKDLKFFSCWAIFSRDMLTLLSFMCLGLFGEYAKTMFRRPFYEPQIRRIICTRLYTFPVFSEYA